MDLLITIIVGLVGLAAGWVLMTFRMKAHLAEAREFQVKVGSEAGCLKEQVPDLKALLDRAEENLKDSSAPCRPRPWRAIMDPSWCRNSRIRPGPWKTITMMNSFLKRIR